MLELNASVPWSDAPHATPLRDLRRCRLAVVLDYQSTALARPEVWGWLLRNANERDLYGRRCISHDWHLPPLERLSPVLIGEDLPSLYESDPNNPNAPPGGEVWLYSRPGDPEPACVLKVG